MDKFLEEILKSDILNDETKGKLREQFATFVENVRDEARKDVAEQYKRDREKLITATDKMVTEAIEGHMKEFAQEFKHLDSLKKKAAKTIVEANKKADERVAKAITFMETKMSESLSSEMKDLLEDRRVERQAVANTIKEAKERSEREHTEFVKRGAKLIDFVIEKEVKKLLKSLHKDIIAARQNNFGRKIFEAYVSEFETSLFSHDAHAKKLQGEVQATASKLTKLKEAAKTEIVKLRSQLTEAQTNAKLLEDTAHRQAKTARLLKNLKGDAREQMKQLLEAAPTEKLEGTFKKFLPVVTESKSDRKPTRSEKPLGSLHTGDKRTLNEHAPTVDEDDDLDDSIVLLQKRAGLKK